MAAPAPHRAALLLGLALFPAVPASAAPPPLPPDSPARQDVSHAALDPQSSQVVGWLASAGGFGNGRMQIDFSIEVLTADDDTPFVPFTPTEDFYEPDCDLEPVPVPPGGALEGESGYACESDGDCHLIVHHRPSARLFEMWRADLRNGRLRGGCLAVWDLARSYGASGRGEQCTSADAAGLPIAPLLFDADEVAAGEIDHAIRFILPNSRIRHRTYVHPGTHATGAASGPASAPAYGARLRLRADYPLASLPNAGARAVARALQRYGMFLADGGTIALTARSDRFTAAKWAGRLGPHDLRALQITDFELVDGGPRFAWSGDCVRTPRPPALPALLGVTPPRE
jgi:serine/threonine-protein kinase